MDNVICLEKRNCWVHGASGGFGDPRGVGAKNSYAPLEI